MFQALIDALRTPDLRNKILFTLGMILVFRFLAHVPLPGVNQDQLNVLLQSSAFVNLLDLFSGGGLARFSIVALGVNPYINASIIMTLLNQTIPALERLSKEGEYGRNKINQYTRVLTVPLALLQGIGVAVFMQKQGVLNTFGPNDIATTLSILASLTAGTSRSAAMASVNPPPNPATAPHTAPKRVRICSQLTTRQASTALPTPAHLA